MRFYIKDIFKIRYIDVKNFFYSYNIIIYFYIFYIKYVANNRQLYSLLIVGILFYFYFNFIKYISFFFNSTR